MEKRPSLGGNSGEHFTKLPLRVRLAHTVPQCELESGLRVHLKRRVAWISVITRFP